MGLSTEATLIIISEILAIKEVLAKKHFLDIQDYQYYDNYHLNGISVFKIGMETLQKRLHEEGFRNYEELADLIIKVKGINSLSYQ